MAIKVKHDGNVTSRIYASAAGGKGKRQAEDAIKLAQLQASAQGRGGGGGGGGASAHAPTTSAPTAHAQLGSPGSLVSPQMSPETRMRLADDALTNDLIKQDFSDAYRAAEQERQGDIAERLHRSDMENQKELFDYKLTQQQRMELDGINSALEEARRSGRYTPEELAELERQADAQRLGIKPLPMAREEPPKPNVQMIGNRKFVQNGNKWDPVDEEAPLTAEQVFAGTKVDEATGKRYGVDKSGKLYEVGSERDDFAALLKLVPDTRTEIDPVTKKPVETGVPLTMEEKMDYLKQLKQMRDEFNARPQPAPSAPVATDPVIAARSGAAPAPAPSPATAAPAGAAAPADEDDEFAQYRRK